MTSGGQDGAVCFGAPGSTVGRLNGDGVIGEATSVGDGTSLGVGLFEGASLGLWIAPSRLAATGVCRDRR